MIYILSQSTKKIPDGEVVSQMLSHVDALVRQILVYELENTPTREAAQLSYETMTAKREA